MKPAEKRLRAFAYLGLGAVPRSVHDIERGVRACHDVRHYWLEAGATGKAKVHIREIERTRRLAREYESRTRGAPAVHERGAVVHDRLGNPALVSAWRELAAGNNAQLNAQNLGAYREIHEKTPRLVSGQVNARFLPSVAAAAETSILEKPPLGAVAHVYVDSIHALRRDVGISRRSLHAFPPDAEFRRVRLEQEIMAGGVSSHPLHARRNLVHHIRRNPAIRSRR